MGDAVSIKYIMCNFAADYGSVLLGLLWYKDMSKGISKVEFGVHQRLGKLCHGRWRAMSAAFFVMPILPLFRH